MKMRCLDLAALERLAERLAASLAPGWRVYLSGELGAGKTTLARALLRSLGHAGAVKSPSYGLLERYTPPWGVVCHLDLYRLSDPEELEFIGLRDLIEEDPLLLIEWPEHGAGVLPPPDLVVTLEVCCPDGRDVALSGISERARSCLGELLSTR